MKLSTRARYGLKIMHHLAKYSNGKPIPLSEIADKTELPENYLEQLVTDLRRSKLIVSERGTSGGYKLVKEPKETNIWEILESVEKTMELTECAVHDDVCKRESYCACRLVWSKMQKALKDSVENYSLEDLLIDEGKVIKAL